MSEVPTPVSESTAAEVVRVEGKTRSAKSVDNNIITSSLLYASASGFKEAPGLTLPTDIAGVATTAGASGNRVLAIKGKVRAIWDGTGTVNFGTNIAPSATQSGMFEVLSGTTYGIGYFYGNGAGSSLGATNSGTAVIVVIE